MSEEVSRFQIDYIALTRKCDAFMRALGRSAPFQEILQQFDGDPAQFSDDIQGQANLVEIPYYLLFVNHQNEEDHATSKHSDVRSFLAQERSDIIQLGVWCQEFLKSFCENAEQNAVGQADRQPSVVEPVDEEFARKESDSKELPDFASHFTWYSV